MPKICAGNFGAGPFKLYQKGANCKISFKTSKGWMTQPGKCAEGPCGDPNFKKNCPKLKCREQISCSGWSSGACHNKGSCPSNQANQGERHLDLRSTKHKLCLNDSYLFWKLLHYKPFFQNCAFIHSFQLHTIIFVLICSCPIVYRAFCRTSFFTCIGFRSHRVSKIYQI